MFHVHTYYLWGQLVKKNKKKTKRMKEKQNETKTANKQQHDNNNNYSVQVPCLFSSRQLISIVGGMWIMK